MAAKDTKDAASFTLNKHIHLIRLHPGFVLSHTVQAVKYVEVAARLIQEQV